MVTPRTADTEKLEDVVNRYLEQSDKVVWERFAHFKYLETASWSGPELTRPQLIAVKTAFLVEDHIPGYSTEYLRLFPVNDTVTPAQAASNRTLLHFILRWCAEEDRHAHVLELYLRKTKQADADELTEEMTREGQKPYRAPHDNLFQLCTYTMLQERATQLFYQSLKASVEDPLLKDILNRLTQDEARHCHFFGQMVLYHLHRRGADAIPHLQDTLDQFAMPLSNTLDHYKRRSIFMARAAKGYHHYKAFDHMKRVIGKFAHAPTHHRDQRWEEFLSAIPTA